MTGDMVYLILRERDRFPKERLEVMGKEAKKIKKNYFAPMLIVGIAVIAVATAVVSLLI